MAKSKTLAYIVSMGNGLEPFIFREVEQLISRGLVLVFFATKFKRADIYAPKPAWTCYRVTWASLLARLPWLVLRVAANPGMLLEALKYRGLLDFVLAVYFAGAMKRCGVEQIHCHFGDHKLFVGYFCKRLIGVPLSVTIHSHELHVNPNEKMFRLALRQCDRVFAVSQLAADILTTRYQVRSEKIRLNRLFVDTEAWSRDRPIRVLTVARFQPQKGLEYLCKAARLLREEDIEFVVVGFGPVDVRALAEAEGVVDKLVIFAKCDQQQLRVFYQSCDIFCLPSITHPEQGKEGIPAVLIEAMACGMPVVATRSGAVGELVEAILVDERKADQLASAILKLAKDPELRRIQGERNRGIVESSHSVQNVRELERELLALSKV